jgi:hypothetical protein
MEIAPATYNSFRRKSGFGIIWILLFAILLVAGSCAAQHKYKKIKSIPCPCEKLNKK